MGKVRKRQRHRTTENRMAPLPSFLPGMRGGANWHVTVADTQPKTLNMFGGPAEMVIPQIKSTKDRHAVLHEMFHAAHSPLEGACTIPNPFDAGVIEARDITFAEELRIQLLTRANIGGEFMLHDEMESMTQTLTSYMKVYLMNPTPGNFKEVFYWATVIWPHAKAWPNGELSGYVLLTEEGEHLGQMRQLFMVVRRGLEQLVTTFEHPIGKMFDTRTPYDWDTVLHMAEIFNNIGQNSHETVQEMLAGDAMNAKMEQTLEEIGAEEGDDFQTMRDKLKEYSEKNSKYSYVNRDLTRSRPVNKLDYDPSDIMGDTNIWGKMKIKRPVLDRRLDRFDQKRARYKATEEGAIPRYPHRAFSDGRIFSKRRKTPGGSVLIDDSGSMHFSTEEIEAIMKAAPAVKIAAYSGDWQVGELSILGDGGKWCEPNRKNLPAGGNNLIDYPALEWLAEQPEPRIWVTDGYVVPKDESKMREAYIQCIEFCYTHNINRVDTASDAHRVFTGKDLLYR